MGKSELSIKNSSIGLIVALLSSQIGSLFFAIIFSIIFKIFNPDLTIETFVNGVIGYALISLVMYIIIFVVFLLTNRHTDNRIVKKPRILRIIVYILLGIILNIVLLPIIQVFDLGLDAINFATSEIPYDLTTSSYIISIFSLCLLPAVVEELLFRGLILKTLKKYGKAISIILSTLAFCLFHMSLRQTLYPILFGLILGLVMYNEDNIVYCMILHFINNLTSITMAYFNLYLNINMIVYVLVGLALYLVIVSVLSFYETTQNEENNTPAKQKFDRTDKIYLVITFSILLTSWIIANII